MTTSKRCKKRNSPQVRERGTKVLRTLSILKVLKACALVMLGGVAYLMIANDLVQFRLERRLAEEEAVIDKPPVPALLTQDSDVSDSGGKPLGHLLKDCVIYLDAPPATDGLASGTLFAWIWADSVVERDGFLIVRTSENIRYRADSLVVGQVRAEAVLKKRYVNERRSWYLFSVDLQIPGTVLKVLPTRTEVGLLGWLKQPRTVASVTSRNGGIVVSNNLLETTAMVIMFVVLAVLAFAGLPRMGTKSRGDVLLELLKATLQVLVGVVLALLIFGLGLK